MPQERISITEPVEAIGPFIDDDVAASQTDVQLVVAGTAIDGVIMPKAGYIVGMSWELEGVASAGSLTIGATIDGTEKTNTTQTITTGQRGRPVWGRNDVAPRFAAGQRVGAEITTDGSWNATTKDLAVFLHVVYEDWDN